jgi:hypothetical protein
VVARRIGLLAAALAALVSAGGATAATITGTPRANLLHGGPRPDTIRARGGDDRIVAQDGGRDTISCGAGRDVVSADRTDRVASDCELVSRQLLGDPLRETGSLAQHATEVEPDSFAWGSKVVATFQSGRFRDGASTNLGVSFSPDAGRTWRSRPLPGLTPFSHPTGRFARVSDPAVAYDARHGVWLVVGLAIGPSTALTISRSADGVTWSSPVVAAEASTGSLAYDKEWIVCDNGAASLYRGSCYISFTDFVTHHLSTIASRDGGVTWSGSVSALDTSASEEGVGATAAQPVVLPNGELHIVFDETSEFLTGGIYDVRSRDGGASFDPRILVTSLTAAPVRLRAPSAPSAEVGGDGRIHLAWSDCRFEADCSVDDILLTSSADGVVWTAPVRIPLTSARSVDLFVPGLAADPGGTGLAVTAYAMGPHGCGTVSCRIRVAYATSRDGGTTWSATRYLEPEPLRLQWLAEAGGRFLGDYISTSFAGGRVVPIFALAAAPSLLYREAIFGTSLRAP